MTLSDSKLIFKKIIVGILIALIPFIILFGGLKLTQEILTDNKAKNAIQK
jgi:hypothetical protein